MEFIKGQFTEEQLENAIVEYFQGLDGYIYIHGETIHRKYEDILIESDLRNYLEQKYTDLTVGEIARAISRLNNIPSAPLYKGNRDAFWLINEGFDLQRDEANKIALHINFIDFENPDNNIFKIINQYSVQGERLRRPDLLLFINGIPVTIFEFKTAIDEGTTIHDAWQQIHVRYCRDIPKLMRFCFLAVVSDGSNTKLGTLFTPYEYYYAWNKANDNERVVNGISSLLTLIKGAFAPDRVSSILQDFVCYPDCE